MTTDPLPTPAELKRLREELRGSEKLGAPPVLTVAERETPSVSATPTALKKKKRRKKKMANPSPRSKSPLVRGDIVKTTVQAAKQMVPAALGAGAATLARTLADQFLKDPTFGGKVPALLTNSFVDWAPAALLLLADSAMGRFRGSWVGAALTALLPTIRNVVAWFKTRISPAPAAAVSADAQADVSDEWDDLI